MARITGAAGAEIARADAPTASVRACAGVFWAAVSPGAPFVRARSSLARHREAIGINRLLCFVRRPWCSVGHGAHSPAADLVVQSNMNTAPCSAGREGF